MVKYLEIFKNELGLQEDTKLSLYGKYKGYEINVYGGQLVAATINFYAIPTIKDKVANNLLNFNGKKFCKVQVDAFGVGISMSGVTMTSAAKNLLAKIKYIIDHMIELQINPELCPLCGNVIDNEKPVTISGRKATICQNCINQLVEAEKEQNEKLKEQPDNYVPGIIGACLGAAIGVISWIVLFFLGFFSAISAIISVFLGDFFYIKFGGKPTKARLFIVAIITFIALMGTVLGFYFIIYAAIMFEEGIEGGVFAYILSSEDKGYFIQDVLFNLVFIGIGIGGKVAQIHKNDQNKKISVNQ